MRAEIFLDTSVLVYAVIPNDLRSPIADRVLSSGGRISAQVLNELANVASRKYRLAWDEITKISADVCSFCGSPTPLTLRTHQLALNVAERYGFHFYDCLIVASALESGCTTLYTEDLQHNQQIETLTVVNPFLAAVTQ